MSDTLNTLTATDIVKALLAETLKHGAKKNYTISVPTAEQGWSERMVRKNDIRRDD